MVDGGAGCNVGYAFVNFITVQDLLHFAKTQLGVKWYVFVAVSRLGGCSQADARM